MKNLLKEFMAAARVSPRLFFAPLVGAFRGIRYEWANVKRKLDHPDDTNHK